ncbi:alpha-ketoacid dehydrogenase subunit beta [Sinomonas halotolerans]|uniref:Alpha-ketoacid dehydrogenase subunit beta n=1 Tax=Sinomonas halotolerans TaxID=1644133 RepID=A0ABU9WWX1_9MICC
MPEVLSTTGQTGATGQTGPATAAARELSLQQALNLALSELLAEDPDVLAFGEDVGTLGGVFRVTNGLAAAHGDDRVFDTPLAESGILGMSIGLAMAGFRPVPEVQFDGFAYPAMNQIVTQLGRMHYRSRGTLRMPVTLRVPSFGGIRAPEHHGESLESVFAHVPGLKVVCPADPQQGYTLLKAAVRSDDPVIFMEPKSRYWQKGTVITEAHGARAQGAGAPARTSAHDGGASPDAGKASGARVAREGRHLTLVAWGAMVARCLQVAELAAEDGIDVEVVDLRWLKPIDTETLAASVAKTRRAVVVHEAPLTAGLGAEVAQRITQACFGMLRAPVERVTGFDVPYPSGDLEDEYIPNIDRILFGIQRVLEYKRG